MNYITGIITFIVMLMLVALILGLPLMLLWNWLMPAIFGFVPIGFWQAVGLNILAGILFKSNVTVNK